jgi:hypothetical protein
MCFDINRNITIDIQTNKGCPEINFTHIDNQSINY